MASVDGIQSALALILAEAANLAEGDSPSVKHACGLLTALVSQVGELCAYVATSDTATDRASATLPLDAESFPVEGGTSGH